MDDEELRAGETQAGNYFGPIRPVKRQPKVNAPNRAARRSSKPLRVLLRESRGSASSNNSGGAISEIVASKPGSHVDETDRNSPGTINTAPPATKNMPYMQFLGISGASNNKAQADNRFDKNKALKRPKIALKRGVMPAKLVSKLHFTKNKLIITSAIVALLIISTGLTFILNQSDNSKPQSGAAGTIAANSSPEALFSFYQKQLDFTLYNPKTLPKGYSIDTTSFKVTDGLLSFYIKTADGVIVTVSEQKKTPDFVAPTTTSSEAGKLATVTFSNSSGNGSLFQSGENSLALFESKTSLIICNVNGIKSNDAIAIIRGLVPVK